MKGYLVIFFTQQNRRHQGRMLGDWIVDLARGMGLHGATLSSAIEGFGQSRHLHSVHFFDQADQPLEIRLAMTMAEAERLFERLATEDFSLFYIKTPIEFGYLGKQAQPMAPDAPSKTASAPLS
ncbi:DUF190 domain-containing protein [Pseudomonas sessilinigenes]|uniref:DUF190 domain-containing protein n=1 Tax=Pseudomonas sessilinigenes TaxID=658629 RepID=A0ABX8MKL7_9PSED|nr:DUF190 domain-containing protein [Pseudomonas sessilinigenes]AZC26101.1 hypothetical protein C4K39_4452 [Pseudomonas sessilinigenes]QXH39869.1 DUF190 domain-containing protein [Pseudomonas sessilinigenes]